MNESLVFKAFDEAMKTFVDLSSPKNPEPRTPTDIAQDALDAWEHGKMSREDCLNIVLATMDYAVNARANLERLFN